MEAGQVYRAASVQEAIRLAKAELGPDALIVDVRRIPPTDPRAPRAGTVEVRAVAAPEAQAGVLSSSEPFTTLPLTTTRRATPGSQQLRALQLLQSMGWSEGLAQRVLETYVTGRRWPPSQRRIALANVIRRAVRLTTLVPTSTERPITLAFCGPSGSGKTLTILKLAVQLKRAQRSVSVLGLGLLPPHQLVLKAWAEQVESPISFAATPAALRQTLATPSSDIILVDTPGTNPFDNHAMKQLRSLLGHEALSACFLVLPLTTETSELIEVAERFQLVHPTGVIATRLDETRRLAAAIGLAEQTRLPIAALSTGTAIPDDLLAATPEVLGELALWTLSRVLPLASG
ncbi:MAG: hypothetical protein IRY86_03055 [Thermorudis peleae]|nr:hypothetical protein [Thermorudis peleae]